MKEATAIPVVRTETRRIKMVFELKKDLTEDEVVCGHCRGTGLEIADNVYGIQGDAISAKTRFPYNNQSLTVCEYCYGGVLKKCPSCGSLIGKKNYECPCGISDKKRTEAYEKKSIQRWEEAKKIPLKEAWEKYKCLYIENIDEFVFDADENEYWIEDYELNIPDLKIYATTKEMINLDAGSVIEFTCSELHEDAYDRCDIEGLQKILDKWCEEQTGTATYFPDYSVGVIL